MPHSSRSSRSSAQRKGGSAGLAPQAQPAAHNAPLLGPRVSQGLAVGIAAGAGQYALVGVATLLGILLVTIVRIGSRYLPGSDKREEE